METEVLKQNDLTTRGLVDGLLGLLANRVLSEDNAAAQELLELRDNGLQTVLGVDLAVGTAEVGHEDDGLGAILDGVLDGGEGTDDTLVVGDVLVGVEGDVEVDLASIVSIDSSLDVISSGKRTRMRTRLSLRSTSVMATLLLRDMMNYGCQYWVKWKQKCVYIPFEWDKCRRKKRRGIRQELIPRRVLAVNLIETTSVQRRGPL